MASATLIPVSEYLRTTFRPDRDYLDGETKERHVGERPHATVQGNLYFLFRLNADAWKVVPLPEQRVQVRPDRFRIPDVCVLRASDPADPVVQTAPLICIEVLSKDDTLSEMQERVNDYRAMGVENIWAVDPWTRTAYYCTERGFLLNEEAILRVPGTAISVALAEVFAESGV